MCSLHTELLHTSPEIFDAANLLFSILAGLVSFLWFNLPILLRARRSSPSSVIAFGFLGAFFTAAFVVVCFLGISGPDTELGRGHNYNLLTQPSWVPNLFGGARGKVLLKTTAPKDGRQPMDERHTPIWLFAIKKGHPYERMHVTLANILDNKTIPFQSIQCQKVGMYD